MMKQALQESPICTATLHLCMLWISVMMHAWYSVGQGTALCACGAGRQCDTVQNQGSLKFGLKGTCCWWLMRIKPESQLTQSLHFTHNCSEMGVGLAAFRGHMLPVWDVAAGPLGYHFASASADRTARVWATDHLRTLRIFAGACVVSKKEKVVGLYAGESCIVRCVFHCMQYAHTHTMLAYN